jgi:hypothetical protein
MPRCNVLAAVQAAEVTAPADVSPLAGWPGPADARYLVRVSVLAAVRGATRPHRTAAHAA